MFKRFDEPCQALIEEAHEQARRSCWPGGRTTGPLSRRWNMWSARWQRSAAAMAA